MYSGNAKAIGIFNSMIDECASVMGPDACELSSNLIQCMRDGAISRGFDPKIGIPTN